MSTKSWPCSACGESVDGQVRFCPSCGHGVTKPKPDFAKTMMGVSPGQALLPRVDLAPDPKLVQPVATESLPAQESNSAQATPASTSEAAAAPARRKPKAGAFGRTMLGAAPAIPSPEPHLTPSPTPNASPDPNLSSRADFKGRTMLGVADGGAVQEAVRKAAAAATAAPAGRDVPGALGGRTMLGAPDVRDAVDAANADNAAEQPPLPTSPLGGPESEAGYPPFGGSTSQTPVQIPRNRGAGGLMVGLVAVLLLGVAVWAWSGQRSQISQLRVRVVASVSKGASASGEEMLFQLGDIPAGASIEFGGQTRAIEGGEARFALSTDSLKVGENIVVATVVFEDGTRESASVPLHVDYRLRLDTAPLRSDEPAVELIATATPGSKVTLDGVELVLDGQGRGTRHYPVDVVEAASNGLLRHVVKYRLDLPAGEPVIGELVTPIPVTRVQLDSPGPVMITDRDFVEIAGLVAKGVQVRFAGAPVDVNDQGRFLHRWHVPGVGEHQPRLVAQAADRAPAGITLSVSRVESLERAAAGYAPKRALSYADIAQNPAMYKGQRVKFEGRVFNVKTERGRGVLQMLVRDCAKGRQCSLWVTYPATTEVVNDSWVRVIGDVDGEQQFRSKRDEVVAVPKVQALFVLPKKR